MSAPCDMQDLGDMNLIVTALKQKLAPFGWSEAMRRGGEQKGYTVSAVRGCGSAELLG